MPSWVNYNLKDYEQEDLCLSVNDRAFQYGDGLFETMIYTHGRLRFLQDHLERLGEGMQVLGLKLSKPLYEIDFEKIVKGIAQKSKLKGDLRVKVQVWRKSGGLYTPESNRGNILIQVKDFKKNVLPPMRVVSLENNVNVFTPFSKFKTLSSLKYVLGGLFKKEKEADDVLFYSHEGYVSELLSSNIFWIKEGIIFTPKLQTGCISGIARKNIVNYLKFNGHTVKKVTARKSELLDADVVLSANVTGVRLVEKIDEVKFRTFDAWRVQFEKAY